MGVVNAAASNDALPLSVFNQSLARILYQEQRFGMLGCEESPRLPRARTLAACTLDSARGSHGHGSSCRTARTRHSRLGTKNGDAAIVEKYAETGATLLKNDGNALPLTAADLAGGILVTGGQCKSHGRRPDQ